MKRQLMGLVLHNMFRCSLTIAGTFERIGGLAKGS